MEIREAATSDVQDIVAFHNANLGDNKKPEHWLWEFKGSYPDSSVFVIAQDGDCVIGLQGMIPIHVYVQDDRVLSGKSESTLVHSGYRGTGLLQKLYEHAFSLCENNGMQFVWGYTSYIAAIKALQKAGFRAYENVMWGSVSFLHPRHASSWIREQRLSPAKKRLAPILSIMAWAYSCALRATCRAPLGSYQIRDSLTVEQDIDDLYRRLKAGHPDLIHLSFDKRYLDWRIYNHPIFKYKTYFAYEGDLLRAYAIVNMHDERMAYLVDFILESVDAGTVLLQHTLGEAMARNVGAMMFVGNSKNPLIAQTFKLLRRFGFLQTSTPVNFVLRNLSFENETALSEIANWCLSGLWTQGFQM